MNARTLVAPIAALFTLTITAIGPGREPARADDPTIEYNAFKTLFLEQVGGAIDREIATVEAALAAPGLSEAGAEDLRKSLAELKATRRQVDDVSLVESLYSSVKDGYGAISDLAREVETGYGEDSALNAAICAIADFRGSSGLQQLSTLSTAADKGLTWYNAVTSLQSDLAALDTTELSPGTRRLAGQLTVLTGLMSNFGDKVPLIGAFLKGYGDVAGGLLKATTQLDARIKASEQGELRDGVHGLERGELLKKLRALGHDGAHVVTGLRDAYITDTVADGGPVVAIWDRAKRRWVESAAPHPSAAELRKRYAFYAKRGQPNPTPQQILTAYQRTLALTLTPSATHVRPGETITLRAKGRLVVDDRPLGNVWVKVALVDHTGFGEGSFGGPTAVRVGESVTWTAPDNLNETYTFEATLDEASAAAGWALAEPASAKVRTGSETRVVLSASRTKVGFGGTVTLDAKVTGDDGRPLDAKAGGHITFEVNPDEGSLREYTPHTDALGLTRTWRAPDKAGRFVIRARYEGATSHALFGTHTAASEAEVTVEVVAPEWELRVAPSAVALEAEAEDQTAVFRIELASGHDAPLEIDLAGDSGPAAERAFWTRSADFPARLTLGPGEATSFEVRFQPSSPKATRLAGRVRARLAGTDEVKTVRFEATRAAKARQVVIRARAENGKALAGGGANLDRELAPGAEVVLSFTPWGQMREFCVNGVVARNKGMKQVVLTRHDEGGCAWGTRDGRMKAAWSVTDETVRWSGPVTARGKTGAVFVVPAEPGTFAVSAEGVVTWSYVRTAPGGTEKKMATDGDRATFEIEVR